MKIDWKKRVRYAIVILRLWKKWGKNPKRRRFGSLKQMADNGCESKKPWAVWAGNGEMRKSEKNKKALINQEKLTIYKNSKVII